MGFKESVRMLRVESGLSQRELSEKFQVGRRTIARWEEGACYPKRKIADRILQEIELMDLSDQCKSSFIKSLQAGRRRGKSAREFGLDDIDQELLCRVVDESANAIYVIEAYTYKILYANKRTETLMRKGAFIEKNKKCYECLANRKSPCENCPLNQITGYEFSEQTIKHFDHKRYLRMRGKKMKLNGKDVYITYITDVTEAVREQHAMERYIKLLPACAAICNVYKDGRIEHVYSNRMYYKLLSRGQEQSLDNNWEHHSKLELIHPDDRENIIQNVKNIFLNPDQELVVEYRLKCTDGNYIKIQSHGIVTKINAGYMTINCTFIELND